MKTDTSETANIRPSKNEFWSQHFQFQWLFEPIPIFSEHMKLLSATVCKDELVALISTEKHLAHEIFTKWREKSSPRELWDPDQVSPETETIEIRCDLRRGLVTTSPATPGVLRVLSDGHTIWRIPHHPTMSDPFIWNGRPASLVSNRRNRNLCQLMEFVDGRWQESDQFALLPDCFDGDGEPLVKIHSINGLVLLTFEGHLNVGFKSTIKFGSQEQARKYIELHPTFIKQMTEDEFRDMGWQLFSTKDRQASFLSPSGFWFKDGIPCTIKFHQRFLHYVVFGRKVLIGFTFDRIDEETTMPSEVVISPISWEAHNSPYSGQFSIDDRGKLQVVATADDRAYILVYGRSDGRLFVMNLTNDQLRIVAHGGGSFLHQARFLYWVLLDAGLAAGISLVIPMLVLTLIGWAYQRRQGPVRFLFGHEAVMLASNVHRVMARLIDQALMLLLLILSVALHPSVISWWNCLTQRNDELFEAIANSLAKPNWSSLTLAIAFTGDTLIELASPPLIWQLFIPTIIFFFSQIIWQGRTGRTVGKWLLSVKVLRTTLRPCGLARSLLREILLVIDSCMLLSWIPGVICILATRNSQRIGDLFADTIVVRDSSRIPIYRNQVSGQ